jgi:hypothetical protein
MDSWKKALATSEGENQQEAIRLAIVAGIPLEDIQDFLDHLENERRLNDGKARIPPTGPQLPAK